MIDDTIDLVAEALFEYEKKAMGEAWYNASEVFRGLSTSVANGWRDMAKAAIEAMGDSAKAAEPVSLEKCIKAIDDISREDGFSRSIQYRPEEFAKAVLDAAGVKYAS